MNIIPQQATVTVDLNALRKINRASRRPHFTANLLLQLLHVDYETVAQRCGISVSTLRRYLTRFSDIGRPAERVVRMEVEAALREAGWSGPSEFLWQPFEA